MKTAFLSLVFFLCVFANAELLVDTDGNYVKNGGTYFIIPAIPKRGGGPTLAETPGETCPLTVVQDFYRDSLGLPTELSRLLAVPYLATGMNIHIEFTLAPNCAPKPARWYVSKDSEFEGSIKVTSNQKLIGDFQVQKVSNYAYKLTYCTGLIFSDCKDLGISYDKEGNRRLVLKNGNPFLVKFKNANTQDFEKWSV